MSDENENKAELEYLRWFYDECDFGPAHEDVIEYMNERFKQETNGDLPTGY